MNTNTPQIADWYSPLADIVSKGSQVENVNGLAGIHEARRQHQGQFFTPVELAAFMWRLVTPSIEEALERDPGSKVTLIDSSIGSARLLQFADPHKHRILGIEVDDKCVQTLSTALSDADFDYEICNAGLQECRLPRGGVALLNPPFSIHFESPLLEKFSSNSFGRFGPGTSAMSHIYALRQAMEECDIVAAIVPVSAIAEIESDEDMSNCLAAVYRIGTKAFLSEGAQVDTAIVILDPRGNRFYGSRDVTTIYEEVTDLSSPLQVPDLYCGNTRERAPRSIRKLGIDSDKPYVTLPVTGDKAVRINRRGKRLTLKFACGLVQAKVENAIYRERVTPLDKHRYPSGVKYAGQGLLDTEILLAQDDPLSHFQRLLGIISQNGGEPKPNAGIRSYLQRRHRRSKIQNTPLRHWIYANRGQAIGSGADLPERFTARATKKHLLDPKRWGSPSILENEAVEIVRKDTAQGARYCYTKNNTEAALGRTELAERFDLPCTKAANEGWTLIHKGRAEAFPEKAQWLANRARKLGLDKWLSWDYQFNDLIEASMTPGGVVCGWMMGLGKARAATALCLLGQGKHNLIVVEANLIDEMLIEYEELGFDEKHWQVIESASDTENLKQVNIISYSRLRMPLHTNTKKTYAQALRNRIHTLAADEGHAISNDDTQQVKALYTVSPKRRYAFTGTPIGNLPRNLLPLAIWCKGDGTADQPFGKRRPFIEPRLVDSMNASERGIDVFRNRFVTTEWVTHEFAEDMSKGAKREVPSLSGIDAYREFASTLVLRRVWGEPEIEAFVSVPDPERFTHNIDWDEDHLEFYLRTAEEFADYWKNTRGDGDNKKINLVSVLARLGAVFQAANNPAAVDSGFGSFTGWTSKQLAAIERSEKHASEDRKTVLYASSPDVLARMHTELTRRGVESALYTGKVSRGVRKRALRDFRKGSAQVLCASFGVAQTGLNIPQATREIFYNRLWSPRQESQAEFRAIRPSQKEVVEIDRLHLPGSLDYYMDLMTAMKRDSANAGLDWGEPEYESTDFTHWLNILDRFCADLAEMRGVERSKLRETLRNAA